MLGFTVYITGKLCWRECQNADSSTVMVMDLSFKYLGHHLDFGVSLVEPSGTRQLKFQSLGEGCQTCLQ
jgi:hypothetical protein